MESLEWREEQAARAEYLALKSQAERIVRRLEKKHGLNLSVGATNKMADLIFEALPVPYPADNE